MSHGAVDFLRRPGFWLKEVAGHGQQVPFDFAQGQALTLRFQGLVNPRKSLTRHWLLCGDHRFQFRLRWHDDPGQHVRDHARTDSGRSSKEDAEDAHERYVEIEILSKPGTNARDLSLGAGAYQFLR